MERDTQKWGVWRSFQFLYTDLLTWMDKTSSWFYELYMCTNCEDSSQTAHLKSQMRVRIQVSITEVSR